MFDINLFKSSVKDWLQNSTTVDINDLVDFCEELIPPNQYTANKWLVEQTVSWYKHILQQQSSAPYSDNDAHCL